VGGRKILWAREKSEKKLNIRKIKIQRRKSGQYIGVAKSLDTTSCIRKRKSPIYSKVIHIFADIKYASTHKKTPPGGGVFLRSLR
jgi:hypothetical protein